jgi:hypothetical protein
MARKHEREQDDRPKVEKDEAGWWNDFYRKVTYVQNEKGQWHADSRRWPPTAQED